MANVTKQGQLRGSDVAIITAATVVCGVITVAIVPAAVQGQAGFLLLASAIGAGVGGAAGIAGGLTAVLSTRLANSKLPPFAHATLAGVVAGAVGWVLGAAVPLTTPLLFGGIMALVALASTWLAIGRRSN